MKYNYKERIPGQFTVKLDKDTTKKVQELLKDVCREIAKQIMEDKIIDGEANIYFRLDTLAVRRRTGNEPIGEWNELS